MVKDDNVKKRLIKRMYRNVSKPKQENFETSYNNLEVKKIGKNVVINDHGRKIPLPSADSIAKMEKELKKINSMINEIKSHQGRFRNHIRNLHEDVTEVKQQSRRHIWVNDES